MLGDPEVICSLTYDQLCDFGQVPILSELLTRLENEVG